MGTNLDNTAKGSSPGKNATRGLILIVVLLGILGSIYAVSRQRAPKMTPEEMVAMPGSDTREHGVSLSDEQAGATGVKGPDGMNQGAGMDRVAGGGRIGETPEKMPTGSASEKPHPPSNYTSLPGIEIASFPMETQKRILHRCNNEHCTCECGMTLAECRNEDSTCRHSLTEVAAVVAEEARKDIASGLIKD